MSVSKVDEPNARTRLLDVAERLFMARGYPAVTLRDICAEMGLTHASLYYHFPEGKQSIFMAVLERNVRRHGDGLHAAITGSEQNLRSILWAASAWLLSQSPMDLLKLTESDMTYLKSDDAALITRLVHQLILKPLRAVLDAAVARKEISTCNTGLIAGALIGMVESLFSVPDFAVQKSRNDMAYELVDILIKGLNYNEGAPR
ncbi:MAG TPA: TetR/AcrR family transcriptional regulator [bacterium]|nr:TetR/AcrR family transcriptional regulator [bacterium]